MHDRMAKRLEWSTYKHLIAVNKYHRWLESIIPSHVGYNESDDLDLMFARIRIEMLCSDEWRYG